MGEEPPFPAPEAAPPAGAGPQLGWGSPSACVVHQGSYCPFLSGTVFLSVSRAVLLRLEGCSHPVVMKGLCAECGQDLTQ